MGAGRGRRTGIILVVLLLVVVLVVALAFVYTQGGLGNQPADTAGDAPAEQVIPPTPTPINTFTVIVAARDLPRGARLTTQDVTTIEWPDIAGADPPVASLFVDEALGSTLEQVEGRITRVDILNGQPIQDFMLTPGDEAVGLSDTGSDAALLTPSNYISVALSITRLSSVAYAIRPGDHVDILMSFDFVDVDEDFQTILPNSGVLITTDTDQVASGLQQYGYSIGREERGIFGTTLLVMPGANVGNENGQIPRRTTQLVIDNAIVIGVGDWPLADQEQPLVVTPVIPTDTPEPVEGEEAAEPPPPPTATPLPPPPDVVTLAMTRQDALVLKLATEYGVDIDLALRSSLDDDILDIVTDPVTLDYIINFYGVTPPERLPIALDPRVDLLNTIFETPDEEDTGG